MIVMLVASFEFALSNFDKTKDFLGQKGNFKARVLSRLIVTSLPARSCVLHLYTRFYSLCTAISYP